MKFYKTKYCDNENLAIIAVEDYEVYGNLTVNINKLPYGLAAIDTNNFPNAEHVAKELGGIPTEEYLASGFCTYPVYDFSCVLDNIENLED